MGVDRSRVEQLLAGWRQGFLNSHPGYDVPDPPHLMDDEVVDLCRALDSGIFEVDEAGTFMPTGLRAFWCYAFVDVGNKKERLAGWFREWITHAGAVARLHNDYGYPLANIGLEVDPALDVLVFSDENVPLVAVEAKRTAGHLRTLLSDLDKLSKEPFAFVCRPPARLSNSYKKFRALLILRPQFFAAVSPGLISAFEVEYRPEVPTALLHPIDRIPAYASS